MSHFPDWEDNDWVMISALEHYAYCPRQCALIHVEKVFEENIYTLRGHRLHENVDKPESELDGDKRIERALPLVSQRLGIHGKADGVEFDADGVPYPVEYKQGKRKHKECDDFQLCAQALCLEEMLGIAVPAGAIYYFSSRRRREVIFHGDLRRETESIIQQTRALINQFALPPPVNDARCEDCSLNEVCMPEIVARKSNRRERLFDAFAETKEALL